MINYWIFYCWVHITSTRCDLVNTHEHTSIAESCCCCHWWSGALLKVRPAGSHPMDPRLPKPLKTFKTQWWLCLDEWWMMMQWLTKSCPDDTFVKNTHGMMMSWRHKQRFSVRQFIRHTVKLICMWWPLLTYSLSSPTHPHIPVNIWAFRFYGMPLWCPVTLTLLSLASSPDLACCYF